MVGAGLIGRRHVEVIARSDASQVACIVDPQPEAAQWADKQNIVWYPHLSEMFNTQMPDGVIIATPNQMHVENGLECIAAKLPILVEKPIADDVHSAQILVEAARNADIPILVGHHRRHNPIIQAAKAKIDAGAVGNIVAAHGMCWLYKPDEYFNAAWRTQTGAGPILINLIHDIDLFRYLIGEVISVHAIQANHTRGHDIEDTAAIILRFASGAVATLSVSDTIVAPWSWELTAAENTAYPATGQNCYLIGGTKGSLEIPNGKIWSQNDVRSWWQPINQQTYEVVHQDPLDKQIDHFCAVISGKATPFVSGEEGLRSLQVIEAIKQSAATGNTVEIGASILG